MASRPITSRQIDGETMKTVTDCRQMVTATMKLKDACTWKKSYDHLDNIFKSRDITLPTKVHLVKAMVFPVVMYGCESWTIKKTEH